MILVYLHILDCFVVAKFALPGRRHFDWAAVLAPACPNKESRESHEESSYNKVGQCSEEH